MSELIEELEKMLRRRAERGNAQSKHGSNAAYSYECYLLSGALDEWMSESSANQTLKDRS